MLFQKKYFEWLLNSEYREIFSNHRIFKAKWYFSKFTPDMNFDSPGSFIYVM